MTLRYTIQTLDDEVIPSAVVVGLCAHGLSIVRDLHCGGVDVIALETDVTLPGAFTRCADVKFVGEINNQGLIDALVRLAEDCHFKIKPILFLTNDRMVETIGNNIDLVSRYYNLSWSDNADVILPLLDKINIEARCLEKGLNYPQSVLISKNDSLFDGISKLAFPIILKPTRPLSEFKTLVLHSYDTVHQNISVINASMPILAQKFIPGDDSSIYFGALVLNNGEVCSRFEGRKLRSRPMGHTTIAIPERNDEVCRIAKHFFDGLNISGPVSLELKRSIDGVYWVIEPTVGRTDFWVGICSANEVNFPLAEFHIAGGLTLAFPEQKERSIWVNEERDPGAVFWLLFNHPSFLFNYNIKGVFIGALELRPALVFVVRYMKNFVFRGVRKVRRLLITR